MFWSEQQQRNAEARAARADEQRAARANFTVSNDEAKKLSANGTIEWLADYERRANARRDAWEASPFARGFALLFPKPRIVTDGTQLPALQRTPPH